MRRLTCALSIVAALAAACDETTMSTDTGTPIDSGTRTDTDPIDDTGVDPGDTGTPADSSPPDDTGAPIGWRAMELPAGPGLEDEITGVHCTSTSACVIATDDRASSPGGFIYAASDTSIGAELVAGEDLTDVGGISGTIGFHGFSEVDGRLIAVADVSRLFLSATGDFTNATSWSAIQIGSDSDELTGINAQFAFGRDASGRWVLGRAGGLFESPDDPAPTAFWSGLWSPARIPPFPSDFAARLAADPTICDMDVGAGGIPAPLQSIYLAPDLSLAMYTSAGLNQTGSAAPGVCISTDGGQNFHNVAFPAIGDERGPKGLYCTGADTCFAFNGLGFDEGSAYVYRTTDASAGVASTWARVSIPTSFATESDVNLDFMFFAPDGTHGWIVGERNNSALLLRTTDGGTSWANVTAPLLALTDQPLRSGFALDADHVWVGGEHVLLYTDAAQD